MNTSLAPGSAGHAAEAVAVRGTPRSAGELAERLEVLDLAKRDDHPGQLAAVAAIEEEAAGLGDLGLVMAARLAREDLRYRQGDVDAAGRALEIKRWATVHRDDVVLARTHSLLHLICGNAGDPGAALEHALHAVELLDPIDASPERRSRYLMRLGNALGDCKSFDDARLRYRQAEQYAIAAGNAQAQVLVLYNDACNECDAGNPQRAWEAAERMVAVAAANALTLDLLALGNLARTYIALGRYAEAEMTIRAGIEDAPTLSVQLNDRADALLILAEAQRHLGAFDRAQESLDRCARECAELGLPREGLLLKEQQAQLYAARGDYKQAFELLRVFHAESEAMHADERTAQARTRQAMFETTEAREQARQFREQALRDQLTGLYNRRYVDEHLPDLLEHAARAGTPLVAALVDLDHFKRINDACSHEVGDRVLVAVAGLLTAAVHTGGTGTALPGAGSFAARFGGEEFLLVLTGLHPALEAMPRLDELRRVVADHPWQPITGEVPVTVSIGVSAAVAGGTQSSLLAGADKWLYTAKRQGRDRVCADPDTTGRRPPDSLDPRAGGLLPA